LSANAAARVAERDNGGIAHNRFDTAYQRLKADIIRGHYQPRQRLVETELATSLGVSRVTVRAVFIRLQQEGFIDLEPNRGASVRSLTLEEAGSMMQVREALLGLAASLAAEKATPADVRELRRLILKMEQSPKLEDYLTCSRRFHERIVELADHRHLSEVLAALSYPLIRLQYSGAVSPAHVRKTLAEARAIVACIEARNSAAAERQMRKHLARVRKQMTPPAQGQARRLAEAG
jgi:DNA-binding GntR family transcriptional regulator